MDLVEHLGLEDLLLHGSPFTFYSSGPSEACSRLDRFFLSSEADDWCHNAIQRAHSNCYMITSLLSCLVGIFCLERTIQIFQYLV